MSTTDEPPSQSSNTETSQLTQATTLEKEAQSCFEKEDYPSSLKNYIKALEIKEEIFGSDHLEIAKLHENVAKVYKKECRYKKSIKTVLKALEIYKAKSGEDSLDVARCYTDLGILVFYRGKRFPL